MITGSGPLSEYFLCVLAWPKDCDPCCYELPRRFLLTKVETQYPRKLSLTMLSHLIGTFSAPNTFECVVNSSYTIRFIVGDKFSFLTETIYRSGLCFRFLTWWKQLAITKFKPKVADFALNTQWLRRWVLCEMYPESNVKVLVINNRVSFNLNLH